MGKIIGIDLGHRKIKKNRSEEIWEKKL